uniref:MFS transporter n=1 Tax=Clostridium thailandense TaxID=2794346 RepID=UPI0035E43360
MSIACAANLYYSQPLLEQISRFFNVSSFIIGTAAMLIQIGYAIGLIFLVPLGDIKERRRLIITMLFCSAMALLSISVSLNIWWLLFSSLIVGLTSITPMLIVPLAAHLAKPAERGKVIGSVMSGLLIGILLSRVFSGIIGSILGWQIVYRIGWCTRFMAGDIFLGIVWMDWSMWYWNNFSDNRSNNSYFWYKTQIKIDVHGRKLIYTPGYVKCLVWVSIEVINSTTGC